jgi:hypothetical protein
MDQLERAAEAARISTQEAAENISDTVSGAV